MTTLTLWNGWEESVGWGEMSVANSMGAHGLCHQTEGPTRHRRVELIM